MKTNFVSRLIVGGLWIAVVVGAHPGFADDPPAPAVEKYESTYPKATSSQQIQTLKHLKTLMIAMIQYDMDHQQLPLDIVDKKSKPLLSWRVALLPYLEEEALYRKFKLDEPWNSEHNKALLKEMPAILRCGLSRPGETMTYVKAFKGPGAFMEPGKKLRLPAPNSSPGWKRAEDARQKMNDFTGPTSQTFGVVEAGPSVPWTRPADIDYDPKRPFPELSGPYAFSMHVVFADGSTAALNTRAPRHILRQLIERSDSKAITKTDWEAIQARPAPPASLKDYYYNHSQGVEAKKPLPPVDQVEDKEAEKALIETRSLAVQEKSGVVKWEYKQLSRYSPVLRGEEAELNKLGEEGWELVTTCPRLDGAQVVVYVFKRPRR